MAYIVKAVFGSESIVKTDTIYQYNSGQVLQIEGLAFTNSTEFHLAIHGKDTASIMTGTIANNIAKITIPEVFMINDFCTCNYRIDVFVYVIDNDSGYTKYKIIIPVKSRPRPKDYYVDLPTVPELKSLKQELNTAVNNFNDAYTEIDQLKSETASLKEDLGNIIYKGLINGFDKDNTVSGYLYNDGNVYGDSRFVTSDYFDVDENKTYYALQMVGTVKYDNVSYICFFDSSKTFIAGGYFHASSCTSPNGSKYARVTFPSDETVKARCMFTSIETPDKYYPFGYEYSVITKDVSELKTNVSELKTDVSELKTRESENRLHGKTMAILGDSMAKGHTLNEEQTWAYKIANRNNMTYQKIAVNGTFITTGHGDSADANCLLEQLKKITGNPDIIIIHMGTNDRSQNTGIGNWSSSNTDTTNIYGALRVAFEYILEHFTSSQVMFITPYFYREQTDYIGAIENACVNIGTVHCKNNKQGGICAWNDNVKSMYFLDNVHLNELGQERVSYEYEDFMRTFM
ncbi:MAG: GDSL-type esterase/lipase family protein [Lachnospiraceae bacterium]